MENELILSSVEAVNKYQNISYNALFSSRPRETLAQKLQKIAQKSLNIHFYISPERTM